MTTVHNDKPFGHAAGLEHVRRRLEAARTRVTTGDEVRSFAERAGELLFLVHLAARGMEAWSTAILFADKMTGERKLSPDETWLLESARGPAMVRRATALRAAALAAWAAAPAERAWRDIVLGVIAETARNARANGLPTPPRHTA